MTTSVGIWLMPRSLASFDRGVDLRLGLRVGGAGRDLGRIEAGLGDGAVQGQRGAIGSRQAILPVKDRRGELEERVAAAQLGHANAVFGCR